MMGKFGLHVMDEFGGTKPNKFATPKAEPSTTSKAEPPITLATRETGRSTTPAIRETGRSTTSAIRETDEKMYRHEYKYLVCASQIAVLKPRACAIMLEDPNLQTQGKYAGFYNIASVYFDDPENTCYLENVNGTDPREKFRIRVYNHSDSKISLELKKKRSGKCLKSSCSLTKEQCEILIRGGVLPDDSAYHPLLQKLLYQIKTRRYHPVVLVEYERTPFVYPAGNVRVTFDVNLRTSHECEKLFDENISSRGVLENSQGILEIKWDEFLPDFIRKTMMTENLRWCSFSKFQICRKFNLLTMPVYSSPLGAEPFLAESLAAGSYPFESDPSGPIPKDSLPMDFLTTEPLSSKPLPADANFTEPYRVKSPHMDEDSFHRTDLL